MKIYHSVECVKDNLAHMDDFSRDQQKQVFAVRLKRAIAMAGYPSQKAFGQAVGLSENTISRYCRAEHLPEGPEMIKIAGGLPYHIGWVLTGVSAIPEQRLALEPTLQELVDYLEPMPEWLTARVLWEVKALVEYGKRGPEAFSEYIAEVVKPRSQE